MVTIFIRYQNIKNNMLDPSIVQKVIESSNIVEVVGDFITLKKSGSNYKGNCPFHNEKTPSFMVAPGKNIFKCFGCGEAGSPINFVMKHEKMEFIDAIKYLAKKYHIDVPEQQVTDADKQRFQERESLLIINAFAQKYFVDNLMKHPRGRAVGFSYFKERGFDNNTIAKFGLGFALEEKTAFTDIALKKGYKLELLDKTGLTIVKENYKFDRFAGRVMFPIHSVSGRVVGFGGRIIVSDKNTAKYLNSPESEIYHKSKELYGLYLAKTSIIKHDKCYMVEGYTDVISLHQAGIENVVASSGTSLTEEQIRLVKRFTENLTVIYDGDTAGIKASLRGIDMILKEGLKVRVVPLPPNEDPDSFSKLLTKDELATYIREKEIDFLSFKMLLLSDEAEQDPIRRASIITEIVSTIALIPNTFLRSVYVKEAARIFVISEQAIYDEITKKFQNKLAASYTDYTKKKDEYSYWRTAKIPSFIENLNCEIEEKQIIFYLLNFGNHAFETAYNENNEIYIITVAEFIIREMLNDDHEFKNLIYKQIFEESKMFLLDTGKVEPNNFLYHKDPQISEISANMLSPNHILSNIWTKKGANIELPEDTYKKDVPKTIIVYKLKILQMALEQNDISLKELNNENFDYYKAYIEQSILLNDIKREIAKQGGERTIL